MSTVAGPHAEELLTRSDLRDRYGLDRRAVDAVMRECPVIRLPGYRRPLVRARAVEELLAASTYDDRGGSRVAPRCGHPR